MHVDVAPCMHDDVYIYVCGRPDTNDTSQNCSDIVQVVIIETHKLININI